MRVGINCRKLLSLSSFRVAQQKPQPCNCFPLCSNFSLFPFLSPLPFPIFSLPFPFLSTLLLQIFHQFCLFSNFSLVFHSFFFLALLIPLLSRPRFSPPPLPYTFSLSPPVISLSPRPYISWFFSPSYVPSLAFQIEKLVWIKCLCRE